jgi:hypothetical protein
MTISIGKPLSSGFPDAGRNVSLPRGVISRGEVLREIFGNNHFTTEMILVVGKFFFTVNMEDFSVPKKKVFDVLGMDTRRRLAVFAVDTCPLPTTTRDGSSSFTRLVRVILWLVRYRFRRCHLLLFYILRLQDANGRRSGFDVPPLGGRRFCVCLRRRGAGHGGGCWCWKNCVCCNCAAYQQLQWTWIASRTSCRTGPTTCRTTIGGILIASRTCCCVEMFVFMMSFQPKSVNFFLRLILWKNTL